MRQLFTITLLLFGLSFVACKKTPVPNFHREYFGLTEGRYVIYNVTDILHDEALGKHETLSYQLKTVWMDTIIDNEGRIAREFHRFKRATPSDPWQISDVWTGIIDGIRGELIEENQRKVKLVFAPTLLKGWDANAYTMLGEQECYYRNIHKDTIINGIELDSTLVVEQGDYVSFIDTLRSYEVYAKHIGLVYKHHKDCHYDFFKPIPLEGTESYYQFVSAGYE